MKAKEKANELFKQMLSKNPNIQDGVSIIDKIQAKQCALIAVDEILWEIIKYADNSREHVVENSKYWQEVKREIENL